VAGMKSLAIRLGWLGGKVETGKGGALADVGDKVVTLSLIRRSVRFQREVPCASIQVRLARSPEPPDRASLQIALSSPLDVRARVSDYKRTLMRWGLDRL
jgi:hypothetical protein